MAQIIPEMSPAAATIFRNIQYVFLDRDGVLNRKAPEGAYITRPEDLELLPGAGDAIARINRFRQKAIVVTNQRAIALGLCTDNDLYRIHETLCSLLSAHDAHLDAIYYCPHDYGQCNCRKPKTGMFEQAFRDFRNANTSNSVMIGDSPTDVEAGWRLGMRTILIGEQCDWHLDAEFVKPDASAESLLDCVERLLGFATP